MLSAPLVRRAAWLIGVVGAIAARLIAAPDGTALPTATASRACAYQKSSVRRTPEEDLRSAVVCLINHVRGAWHLPPVRQSADLDRAAQSHDGQMVALRDFSHYGAGGSSPASRVSSTGYRWSAVGEALATGFSTPVRVVAAWLASPPHCQILLSPDYRAVGIGVVAPPVRGDASGPGTWTADFALARNRRPPSGNWGPADSCPH
jgi:uncharacterized protein YkwD